MPVSCTSYKYDPTESLFAPLKFIDVALRGGAGINVILDEFVSKPAQNKSFYFYLPEDHPDFKELTEEQKAKCLTLNQVKEKCQSNTDSTIVVNDSMEESASYLVSIQQSWLNFIDYLAKDIVPIIDLSNLRFKGTTNKVGLEASGPVSFLSIYEVILNHINKGDLLSFMQLCGQMNEVLRRGGQYKNGIVTFSLIYAHPEIIKYLNIPLAELPGSAKKGVRIDEGLKANKRVKFLIKERVNDKSLMLEKRVFLVRNKVKKAYEYVVGKTLDFFKGTNGNVYDFVRELYSNVCREILFDPKGTCLLLHENLAQITTLDELTPAFIEGMTLLVDLFGRWKSEVGGSANQYLSNEEDRQVGLGVFGLANLLKHLGITYKQHVLALEAYLNNTAYDVTTIEWKLAEALVNAYQAAANIAKEAGLERAFTIAPTQSCAYRYTDLEGNTACKNIYPPLAARVRRTSYTVKELAKWYYHGEVETIQSVVESESPEFLSRLVRTWQALMNTTGMAHSISHDLYYKIDEEWLDSFIDNSNDITVYYQFYDKVNQNYLNKGTANVGTSDKELTGVCAIDNPNACAACGE
jgi:hypothetical protein